MLEKTSAKEFLLSAPYILFLLGIPIVLGYCFWKAECTLWQALGIMVVFCSLDVLVIIATRSFFEVPLYELPIPVRLFVELGSWITVAAGLLLTLGYCLWHEDINFKKTTGALVAYIAFAFLLLVTIHLTVGYKLLPIVFAGK